MNNAIDKIKQTWNENPMMVISIGATAVFAVAKLMDANTNRRNQKVWQMEVMRRSMMKSR